jgi:hypothetical protein
MRDIIARRVAKHLYYVLASPLFNQVCQLTDIVERVGLGDVLALLPDDNDELALVVQTGRLLCHGGDLDRICRARQRRARLVLRRTSARG